MAFLVPWAIASCAAFARGQLLVSPPVQVVSVIQDAAQDLCADINRDMEVQTAAARICPTAQQRLSFLSQAVCDDLVKTSWTYLKERCSRIAVKDTSVGQIPLGDFTVDAAVISLKSGCGLTRMTAAAAAEPSLQSLFAVSPLQQFLPALPVLQQAAGVPADDELICKALNNSALEKHAEQVLCDVVEANSTNMTAELCGEVVQFAWRQEAIEAHCPGAPQRWQPFHILNGLAEKLMCLELKKGMLVGKEKKISAEVCHELADDKLNYFACEFAVRQMICHFEERCSKHLVVEMATDMLNQAEVHV